ncbi:hypothetical protein [Scytonema hofmannii]|uniref:hypothetical protein n=1 Tax=Scytonema hofmannii TaxID=34078 RepID=UPI0003469363|nr:hypothetical protein [Scytonema hofmannii]
MVYLISFEKFVVALWLTHPTMPKFSVDGAGEKKIISNSGDRTLTKGMIGLVEAKAT